MSPTIQSWSAATMPNPKSIWWSHAYPGHWDQQQILVPTVGLILSRSLTLTSGGQGKTNSGPNLPKLRTANLVAVSLTTLEFTTKEQFPLSHFVLAFKYTSRKFYLWRSIKLQNLLYICSSPIHAVDTVTSQNRTATLLVVSLSCGKFTCILRCLLP